MNVVRFFRAQYLFVLGWHMICAVPMQAIGQNGAARLCRIPKVIYQLAELFLERENSEYVRPDKRPEFTAKVIHQWLRDLGVKTFNIEPGSPRGNGYLNRLT